MHGSTARSAILAIAGGDKVLRRWRLAPLGFRPYLRRMYRVFQPCLPTRALKPPSGEQWVHEIKHDGYRLIAQRSAGGVRLLTKNGVDWTRRYPRIAEAIARLRIKSIALDGEVAALDPDGSANFNELHSRTHDDVAVLLAFDLLEIDGEDIRELPLIKRKALLAKLLQKPVDGLQYVEHLTGDGAMIFEHVCRLGGEGIVSKRIDSRYRAGPSKAWVKIKNRTHPALFRVAEAQGSDRAS